MFDPSALDDYFEPMSAAPAPAAPPQQRRAPQPAPMQPMSLGRPLGAPVNTLGLGQRGGGTSSALKMAGALLPVVGALGQTADVLEDRKNGEMTAAKAAALVTLIMLGIGVRFGAGYLVGKAMAPDEESEQKFAWGGALASVFFGTLGLGVEGIVALNARKD